MGKSILIDPRMFQIQDEREIENNLSFFRDVIALLENGKFSIVLYNDLYSRILQRDSNPFPISSKRISNEELKNETSLINNQFYNTILNNIRPIEIDDCEGDQSFSANPDLKSYDEFLELYCVMLGNCYRKEIQLDQYVLCGFLNYELYTPSVNISEVTLECNCCSGKSFRQVFLWKTPDFFCDTTPDYKKTIHKMIEDTVDLYVETPETIRADHHCPFQNKSIKNYNDISARNKQVISLLRFFGLKKIIFKEFHQESKKQVGTLLVNNIEKTDTQDILTCWLYCENKFKTEVQLYFGLHMGEMLAKMFNNEMTYQKVRNLKEYFFT